MSVCAYGAMMALAGLIVDCAWDSQPSSCAFSWDPEKTEVNILKHIFCQITGLKRSFLLIQGNFLYDCNDPQAVTVAYYI